jgi:hypothetical protein
MIVMDELPPYDLPPYLLRTEPMELEDIPLQVALLTMEIANMRRSLEALTRLMENAAREIRPLHAPE